MENKDKKVEQVKETKQEMEIKTNVKAGARTIVCSGKCGCDIETL
jgi:hypothetical protein